MQYRTPQKNAETCFQNAIDGGVSHDIFRASDVFSASFCVSFPAWQRSQRSAAWHTPLGTPRWVVHFMENPVNNG